VNQAPADTEDLVAGLNPPQKQAVLHGEGPLLIVAGAGSGKTAVLTRRIAHLVREKQVSPFAILAITFTNKAADEVKERVASLVGPVARKMWIGTFHASCVRILRSHAARIGYRSNFTIYDSGDSERLISYVMRDANIDPKRIKPSQASNAISRAKDELIDPATYQSQIDNWLEREIAGVYSVYQKRLAEANALDFDDLIMLTVRLFRECPDVLDLYRQRWEHIMIDEFQDTNAAQFELVRLLGGGVGVVSQSVVPLTGARRLPEVKVGNVAVVGDMDQSVYGFRGADYRNLARFEEAFPTAEVITLEQNYRSSQHILSAANALIENNRARKPKNLWTDSGPGESIVRYHADNEHDEAAFVSTEIQRLRDTDAVNYGEVALFYRTNAQSRVVEEILSRFGIPYRIVGGVRFYQRKEVKDLLAYLRVLANEADTVSLKRIVNTPRRGLGDRTIAELEAYAAVAGITLYAAMEIAIELDDGHAPGAKTAPDSEGALWADVAPIDPAPAHRPLPGISKRALGGITDFVHLIRELQAFIKEGAGVKALIEVAWERSGYMSELVSDRSIEALGRVENLKELSGVAGEFEERVPGGSLEEFLAQVALVGEQDEYDATESSVTLMTVHNAKGLEFPVVFILGLEEGVFPHMRSLSDPDELEEERRLAYVGITRAKQRLYLTHAWNRSLWGGTNYNPPSRFLKEIPAENIRTVGEGPGRKGTSVTPRSMHSPRNTRYPDLERATAEWRIGQEVSHDRYGQGVITSLSGSGEKAEATIYFSEEGEKRLILAYAPIKSTG